MPAMTARSDIAPDGIAFAKMHGLGNDFVVLDQRVAPVPLHAALIRAIGDRRRGVGFDQLAEILPGSDADIDLVFWNSDGSTAGACGNATRCIAEQILTEHRSNEISLRTERGRLTARRRPDGVVEVNMGAPMLDWASIPLREDMDSVSLPIQGDPAACSMGNPHCTFFVDDADAVDLAGRGAAIERHDLFPERTNVQFVQVLSPNRARVRVWERGVGVTLASGSSSCAVLVNAHRRGLMERQATLLLDGGEIEITWADNGDVLMAGPTTHVFTGRFSPEWIAANS